MPTAWLILMNSCLSAVQESQRAPMNPRGDRRTLGAAADEQGTLPDKVLGDISKLLEGL